jgi:hypothetical protein
MSSYNLLSYKEARIEALLKKNLELEKDIQKLETFIFELCDKSCPTEYKNVILKQIFKTQDND